MAKISARVFKAGNVLAPDAKWTGDEPTWNGWETWPIEKFMAERMRMLTFYGYYLVQADLKPAILDFMKRENYSKADIDLFRGAGPNVLPSTVGKLVRAMDRGMPSLHPQAQDYFDKLPFSDPENPPVAKDDKAVVKAYLHDCLVHLRGVKAEATVDSGAPKPNFMTPMDRLRLKVNKEVIYHLDGMLDVWTENTDKTKVEPLPLASFIRDGNIPAAGCKHIVEWLQKHLDEYRSAYDKTCPQCVEGFSDMTRPAIRNRISLLEGMLAEVAKHSTAAKAQRKPRVKKVKDASKQVARLKFQQNSKDYSLESIAPSRIPTAQRLYVFNTKYRTLGVYFAKGAAGFEVKGTSLKNIDESASFVTTLRKPNDVLPTIMGSTPKQIDKALDAMKCKKRSANGRINPQTVLVRVIEHRV